MPSPAETRERLRRQIRAIEQRPPSVTGAVARPPRSRNGLSDARRRPTSQGLCTYVERAYPLEHEVGHQALVDLAEVSGDVLAMLAPREDGVAASSPEELLFLDIETTGLGGSGAMTFLVATGRLESGAFVLRQYLAETPAEEPALLDALIEDAAFSDDPVLVTYNGRRFDAPMLDQRATMHRRRAGFEGLRHIDLLHTARRVFGRSLPSCRLADVEAHVLGLTRPSADVDGAEVPAWYFRFLRSGDMRFIGPLASHNELDVLSLAALIGHLGALLAGSKAADGSEALGLARLCEGQPGAERWLEIATALLPPSPARDEALWRQAIVHRRAGRRDLAAPLWEEIVARPGTPAIAALVELAKYYEHELRDFGLAIRIVQQALAHCSADDRRHPGLLHRLARLERRRERATCTAAHRPVGTVVSI